MSLRSGGQRHAHFGLPGSHETAWRFTVVGHTISWFHLVSNSLQVLRYKGETSRAVEAVFAYENLLLGELDFVENSVDLLHPRKTLSACLHREDGIFVAGFDEQRPRGD